MQARKFEQFLKQLATLTLRQRQRLLDLVLSEVKRDQVVELIEQHTVGRLACPGCGAREFHKHGRAHGLQRYRCRNCGRTCNGLSGTPLARLRNKGRWLDYLGGMLDSHSIRRAAAQLGVAGATSFRWRHRFLALSRQDRPARLGGSGQPPGRRTNAGAIHVQNVNPTMAGCAAGSSPSGAWPAVT